MKSMSSLVLLCLSLTCMAQKEILTIEGQSFEAFAGPNLIRVSENFYADQTEVTNIFYKEYLHWIKTVYGIHSQQYIDAQPDASVWHYQNKTDFNHEAYFLKAEFDDYPLVGITLDQARKYSSWRTERVLEMLLIEKGYLNPIINPDKNHHFSIENYENGTVKMRSELDSFIVYPEFTIPTIEEWEALSGIRKKFKYGIDSLDENNKSIVQNNKKKSAHNKIKSTPTESAKFGFQNIYGLFHTIGNVAELVDTDGIAKGGDWMHETSDFNWSGSKKQNIPNCWTGFRNVGRLKILRRREG